jgi:hypothetical protein
LFENEKPDDSSTPILDMGVLPAQIGLRLGRVLVIGVVVGVVSMELLGLAGGMPYEHWPAVFFSNLVLAIFVHEAGHLLAGWAVGFQFSSFQIGPLSLQLEFGVMKTQFSWDIQALGYTGMYADRMHRIRRRSLIYIAGGPAANLLTTLLTVILFEHMFPLPTESVIGTAAGQFGAVSLLLGMVSLVPVGGTDGALIEMLISSYLCARRWICNLALGAQFARGIRPGHWKRTWLRTATSIPDGSRGDFSTNWMAYMSANDRKNAPDAGQHLERCLRATPALGTQFRNMAAHEAAVFMAWFREDTELAEKWASHVKRPCPVSPLQQIRLEVALNCGRRRFDAAISAWEKGAALIGKLPSGPQTKLLKESWAEWRAEIQERQRKLPDAREVKQHQC